MDTQPLSHPLLWGTDATSFGEPASIRVLKETLSLLSHHLKIETLPAFMPKVDDPGFEEESLLVNNERGIGSESSLDRRSHTISPEIEADPRRRRQTRKDASRGGRPDSSKAGETTNLGIDDPSVGIVVSVEYDTNHKDWSARYGYTRNLQITQWTFAVSVHASCAVRGTDQAGRETDTQISL